MLLTSYFERLAPSRAVRFAKADYLPDGWEQVVIVGSHLPLQLLCRTGSEIVIVPAGFGVNSFVIAAVAIAALYLTREILVPLAWLLFFGPAARLR